MVDFLVIGHQAAATYICLLHRIIDGGINIGYNRVSKFDGGGQVGCYWYSSLDVDQRPFLELKCSYDSNRYKKFDYFDAINIDKLEDIPYDYDGVMGVPFSFLEVWNRDQFEIVDKKDCTDEYRFKRRDSVVIFCGDEHFVEGKGVFTRILIKRK